MRTTNNTYPSFKPKDMEARIIYHPSKLEGGQHYTVLLPIKRTQIPYTPLYRAISAGMTSKERRTLLDLLEGFLISSSPHIYWHVPNLREAFDWGQAERYGLGTFTYWRTLDALAPEAFKAEHGKEAE